MREASSDDLMHHALQKGFALSASVRRQTDCDGNVLIR